jgi:hypothetical protein
MLCKKDFPTYYERLNYFCMIPWKFLCRVVGISCCKIYRIWHVGFVKKILIDRDKYSEVKAIMGWIVVLGFFLGGGVFFFHGLIALY